MKKQFPKIVPSVLWIVFILETGLFLNHSVHEHQSTSRGSNVISPAITSVVPAAPQNITPNEAMAMVIDLHGENDLGAIVVSCSGDYNGQYHISWKNNSTLKTGMDYVNDQTGKITPAPPIQ